MPFPRPGTKRHGQIGASVGVSRRDVLRLSAGALAGMLAPQALAQEPSAPVFKKPGTPAEAVELLMAGNRRYGSSDLTSFAADRAILRAHSEQSQEPFAGILSCADSRVPPEILFDQPLGHLFVVRVAGNIAAPDTIASLEYGAAVLGIKTIMVLGHTNCGAVKAAAAGKAVPGQISTLFPFIHPATKSGIPVDKASAENAAWQASLLRETSPVIHPMVEAGTLSVVAAIYNVADGTVAMVGQ